MPSIRDRRQCIRSTCNGQKINDGSYVDPFRFNSITKDYAMKERKKKKEKRSKIDSIVKAHPSFKA